ncbi:hypothetical protein IAR55_004088 [Kwoniella newhampshirensis]|uniref:WD40 repeat-like protein n=1 Tax=Kwoniella newhampshirensis TaxID=1651941 RepID=A0AAW0YY12_9TREE
MTSVILIHPTSLSSTTIPKPHSTSSTPTSTSPNLLNSTSIALPTRFPKDTQPQIVTSSENHSFLYHLGSHTIWEYDERQRRVSEIGVGNKDRAQKVVCLSKDVVLVCTTSGNGDGLKVMEKVDGRGWKCINTLEVPDGAITALAVNSTLTLVAVGSEHGELVVYDREKGSRMVVPLGKRLSGPVSPLLKFSPSLSSTLVLPSTTSPALLRLTLPNGTESQADIREIRPYGAAARGEITDVAFSPVAESADGVKKGGLCAILRQGGVGQMVALVGLDNPDSAAKLVSFGEVGLESLIFLDGATLAARSSKGTLLLKDLRALSKAPVEMSCGEPIAGTRVLPTLPRVPRPSLAPPSTTSSRRATILGENRNTSNMATPSAPPVPRIAEEKIKESPKSAVDVQKPQEKKVVWNEDERERIHATSAAQTTSGRTRIVSAPTTTHNQPPRAPRQSNSRSTSGPPVRTIASDAHRTQLLHGGGARGTTPIVEEDEEEEETASSHHGREEEPSVDLTWALKPVGERGSRGASPKLSDAEKMEEMRREIGNLQLDMLRMGRSLRNEIRKAVQPLLEEVKENREVIERQRREIERLRRGY